VSGIRVDDAMIEKRGETGHFPQSAKRQPYLVRRTDPVT
jgi:hypothetical protein